MELGRAMTHTISSFSVTEQARVQTQVSLYGIFIEQSATGTDFSARNSDVPNQCHSTSAPHSFIHLTPTLCNLNIWKNSLINAFYETRKLITVSTALPRVAILSQTNPFHALPSSSQGFLL
jgi:hypothetical protein